MSAKAFFHGVMGAAVCGVLLTGCGLFSSDAEEPEKAEAAVVLPELDMKRVESDEKWGIKFSEDKRTLLKYEPMLRVKKYVVPARKIRERDIILVADQLRHLGADLDHLIIDVVQLIRDAFIQLRPF